MSDQLKKLDNSSLSIAIEDLVTGLNGHQITNRLLDGTYHIQSIGEAQKEISFTCYSYKGDKELINSAWFIGELLNLDYEGTRYTGLITANPKWKIHVEGLNPVYVTELNMAVIEEGVL